MKTWCTKTLLVGAISLSLITPVWASMQLRAEGANQVSPNDTLLGGPAIVKCPLLDENGRQMGVVLDGVPNFAAPIPYCDHEFRLPGSSLALRFSLDSDHIQDLQFDENALRQFPDLAPYKNQYMNNAIIRIATGNHNLKDPNMTLKWKGTGKFKDADSVIVRCVFLVSTTEVDAHGLPLVLRCVSCLYFIHTKDGTYVFNAQTGQQG